MDDKWVPFLSAIAGGFVVMLAQVVSLVISARLESRRERTRLAAQSAIEEYRGRLEIAKLNNPHSTIYPLAIFTLHHFEVLDLIEKGELTPESMRAVRDRQRKILEGLD